MPDPLDVLRAQVAAIQAQADVLALLIDQMRISPQGTTAPMPIPEPIRPATAPATGEASPISSAPAGGLPRLVTFDDPPPVDVPAVRTIAPDASGDLRPT